MADSRENESMVNKEDGTRRISDNREHSTSDSPAKAKGAIPEFSPLPDITDTSYMNACFQAPPRFSTSETGEIRRIQSPNDTAGEMEGAREASGDGSADSAANNSANTPSPSDAKQAGTEPPTPALDLSGKTWQFFEKGRKRAHKYQLSEDLYEAATAHFLSSYRNPLEEEIVWKSPKIRIPILWWILFFLSALASVLVIAIMFLFPELVDIPHLHSISRPLLIFMVLAIVSVGWLISFVRLKKPVFWNKFHTIYSFTCFLWGFGGVSGFSSLIVTAWIDATYVSSDVRDIVSLILPISLWAGFILIVPLIVAARLIPVWERRAPLIRLGAVDTFWGAYAGIILTLIAPYISRERPLLSFVVLMFAVFPTAGAFTTGIVVSLPIRWPISFTAYLNYLLGILLVSFGVAVIMSYVLVPNIGIAGGVVLTLLVLVMAGMGLWAILGISQASDPLLRSHLENLQTWVDADVISPDEHEFICNEFIISTWGLTALRRGVFLAARDYYRAVMRLAFLDFGDERAKDLSNTIRMTRRKLEAAGIPPCTDFASFSEVPIYPDVLS